MTDHNFTNLPTLDLLGMLYSAQANYANAKSDREREIVQKQKTEILAANAPKNFFEKVLDKTESWHYNFLPINGLFVIKFHVKHAIVFRLKIRFRFNFQI